MDNILQVKHLNCGRSGDLIGFFINYLLSNKNRHVLVRRNVNVTDINTSIP